jgi:hypothetical protein
LLNPTIIGISGHKGSGKDTLAAYIADHARRRGYKVLFRSFGSALKEEAAYAMSLATDKTYEELLNEFNDVAKKERWRLLLQLWGTELRRTEAESYWLNCLQEWIEENSAMYVEGKQKLLIFVPDVRFNNEAEFIRDRKGFLIRIERPGRPLDKHSSETELDNYTYFNRCILNAGTKIDLDLIAQRLLQSLEFWGGVGGQQEYPAPPGIHHNEGII